MSLAPNIRVNGIAPGPTIKNKRQSEKHFKNQYLATPPALTKTSGKNFTPFAFKIYYAA
jgi:hypothetical protein